MAKLDYSQLRPRPDPNWREKAVMFMRLPPITKEEMKSGGKYMEKITAHEFFSRYQGKW